MKIRRLLAGVAVLTTGCAATPPDQPGASVGNLVILTTPAGGGQAYLGSSVCRACHPAVWDRWRATRHAAPFAGLGVADRANASCLRCHVTGYGDPLGYRRGDSPELATVGCESCHGAGADHARSSHPGLVPTATGGQCPPCETNRICRLCHTVERSPDFELGRDLARISCSAAGR